MWKLTRDADAYSKVLDARLMKGPQKLTIQWGFQLGVFEISARYGSGATINSSGELVINVTQRNIYDARPFTQYNTFEK